MNETDVVGTELGDTLEVLTFGPPPEQPTTAAKTTAQVKLGKIRIST